MGNLSFVNQTHDWVIKNIDSDETPYPNHVGDAFERTEKMAVYLIITNNGTVQIAVPLLKKKENGSYGHKYYT